MSVSSIWSIYHFIKNGKKHKMHKSQKWKMHNFMSKNSEKRGVSISALKPGPVVPPGTQKTPDQAARISQSVDFGHLSDILTILRGGHFFHYFLTFFTFLISHFSDFCVFTFCWFFHFLTFSLFPVFLFSWFLTLFCHFLLLTSVFVTFCH